ncbi:hypothetical protein O7599_17335 [Streptomyces sp. WMMC500]|uniref:hypothetical protein n=1 Tax=Streptomyces sp. WMMC500 TaxID=3015154 RepID=UPI00248CC7FD|nr:hypothetical protein [Streptomyces sp. WMMC500]WBB64166.1 hypothetical protein O7599_17335 [Streptomyces sp. WMMC500]
MWRWLRRRPEIAVAVLVAVLIAVVAQQRFGDRSATSADSRPAPGPSAAHVPGAADLRLRVERVGAALAEEPLYEDPESERALDAAERGELLDRIRAFDHGVYVAIVPMQREDESGGDSLELMRRLHERVGRDGVYVVADPYVGDIDVANYGTLLDSDYLAYELPERLPRADANADVDDVLLPERLGALLTLLGEAPRNSTPGEPPYQPLPEDDEEYEPEPLPSVFGADFGPGLAIGAVLAAALFGLVVAAFTPLRVRRRRRAAMWVPLPAQLPAKPLGARAAGAVPAVAPRADDFRAPGRAELHRAAQDALRSLAQRYAAVADGPGGPGGAGVVRAADCLDAALLAVDGRQDGRVDRDADAAALVCALVLARAGHAALSGAPHHPVDYRCCATNPLHGPELPRPDPVPLCAACRHSAVPTQELRLLLPTAQGPLPYDEVPGPPAAAATGITALIRQVREYAGVPH